MLKSTVDISVSVALLSFGLIIVILSDKGIIVLFTFSILFKVPHVVKWKHRGKSASNYKDFDG